MNSNNQTSTIITNSRVNNKRRLEDDEISAVNLFEEIQNPVDLKDETSDLGANQESDASDDLDLIDPVSLELKDYIPDQEKWDKLPTPSKYINHLQSYLTIDEIETIAPIWSKLVSNTNAGRVAALLNTLGTMHVEKSHFDLASAYDGASFPLLHHSRDNRTEHVIITPFTIFRVYQENPGLFQNLTTNDDGYVVFRLKDSKAKLVSDGLRFKNETDSFSRDLAEITKHWLVVPKPSLVYHYLTNIMRVKLSLLGAQSLDNKTTQFLNTPTSQLKLTELFFGTFDVSKTPNARLANAIASQKFNTLCKMVYLSPKEILNYGEYVFIYFCHRCSTNPKANAIFLEWSLQLQTIIAAEVRRTNVGVDVIKVETVPKAQEEVSDLEKIFGAIGIKFSRDLKILLIRVLTAFDVIHRSRYQYDKQSVNFFIKDDNSIRTSYSTIVVKGQKTPADLPAAMHTLYCDIRKIYASLQIPVPGYDCFVPYPNLRDSAKIALCDSLSETFSYVQQLKGVDPSAIQLFLDSGLRDNYSMLPSCGQPTYFTSQLNTSSNQTLYFKQLRITGKEVFIATAKLKQDQLKFLVNMFDEQNSRSGFNLNILYPIKNVGKDKTLPFSFNYGSDALNVHRWQNVTVRRSRFFMLIRILINPVVSEQGSAPPSNPEVMRKSFLSQYFQKMFDSVVTFMTSLHNLPFSKEFDETRSFQWIYRKNEVDVIGDTNQMQYEELFDETLNVIYENAHSMNVSETSTSTSDSGQNSLPSSPQNVSLQNVMENENPNTPPTPN